MSFASAVKRGQSRSPPPQSVSPPGRANNDPPSVDGSGDEDTSVPDEDNVNAPQAVLDKQYSKTCKNPDAPSALPPPNPPRRDHPPRGRGRDCSRGTANPRGFSRGGVNRVRGRGVRGRDNSLRSRSGWDWSNDNMSLLERAQSLISLASAFSNVSGISYQARHITRDMSPSYDDTRHFEVPAYAKKKERQRENRRHKIITGKSQTNANFWGAPEGNKDLFIFRVHPDTVCTDIEQLLVDQQCEVRNLDCVSNPNSIFKSFKLTVPASHFGKIYNENFPWPEGVSIRKFIPPRRA